MSDQRWPGGSWTDPGYTDGGLTISTEVEQVDLVEPMETCSECGTVSSGGWAHAEFCSRQTAGVPTPPASE